MSDWVLKQNTHSMLFILFQILLVLCLLFIRCKPVDDHKTKDIQELRQCISKTQLLMGFWENNLRLIFWSVMAVNKATLKFSIFPYLVNKCKVKNIVSKWQFEIFLLITGSNQELFGESIDHHSYWLNILGHGVACSTLTRNNNTCHNNVHL